MPSASSIPTELIQKNVKAIAKLEKNLLDKRQWDDKAIDWISAFFGHKSFAYLNAVFFAVWIGLNQFMKKPFDEYPYQFLTLVVSLEAIFLSIFILVSQNRQSLLTERRSHIDLQLNLLNEQETTAQTKLLLMIAEKLGLDIKNLPEEMTRYTDINDLADSLEHVFKKESLPCATTT